MRAFQSSYKDKRGRTRRTLTWYVEFTDHLEVTRRVSGFRDRKATESLGRRIEQLVWCKVGREPLPPELSRWIEGLTPKIRKRLATLDLLSAGKVAAMSSLLEHISGSDDAPGWRQYLKAKGNTAAYVDKTVGQVERVFGACGFINWSDLSPGKMMKHLDDLRADTADEGGAVKRGLSARTFNSYLGAVKAFCRWMVKDGRASESPLAHLDGLNVRTDRRIVRRALSVEELSWLLASAGEQPERYGMTGAARALLYRLAVETGLRAGELASLKRSSFALDADNPTVTVEAAYSKHRREDILPLRANSAAALAEFMASKLPTASAFAMPPGTELAAMLREDLAAARQAWMESHRQPQERTEANETAFLLPVDDSGRVVDFHALRHTAGSLLAAGGVHPKVAQSLMRHSDINLTLSVHPRVRRSGSPSRGRPAGFQASRSPVGPGYRDRQCDPTGRRRNLGAKLGASGRIRAYFHGQGRTQHRQTPEREKPHEH